MRTTLLLLSLLFVSPAFAQAEVEPISPGDVAARAIERYIVPAFETFAGTAQQEEDLIATLCAAPGPDNLAAAQAQYRVLVGAYARVSFVRFGPLARDNRNERLLFWPDRKSIALRQVQSVLADADDSETDWQTLRDKSVALQGLPALEFALFGTGAEALATAEPQSFRCRFAHAVAGAIRSIAQESAAEWANADGFAQRLTNPSASDPDYRSTREVLEELVGALAHGLEAIRDTQLLTFIGREGAAPKPRSAPLWRSNATIILAAEAMEGIADFLDHSGIARAAGADGDFVANAVAFEANNIARGRAVITGNIEDAVADPAQLQGLRYLVILTQSMQGLIGDQLSAALGLSVGFSSLDGD